ncbi:MAG: GNAT family N-acetyltransferase [Dehalococcoidia bacterium]|nr:GNAT family N-acetyltransferase [Dehalococcoidia bacterium]
MADIAQERPHGHGFDSIELVGTMVKLRPTAKADAKRAYALHTYEPDFTRFLAWSSPKSAAELSETYGERWQEEMHGGQGYALAIEERLAPDISGSIHLHLGSYPAQVDVGYWLGKPSRNRGYMSEALGLVCRFGFEYLGAGVISGSVSVGNAASRRVMESIGFKLDGSLRRHILKDGQWIDI